DQIRDKLPYTFEDLGERSVKNIARPVRAYRMSAEAVRTTLAIAAPMPLGGRRLRQGVISASINPNGPFYQSTFFWGCVGAVITIVVRVVAAMIKDLRWLLVLAWPFIGLAVWEFSRTWSSPLVTKWLTGVGTLITGFGLLVLYIWLVPSSVKVPI